MSKTIATFVASVVIGLTAVLISPATQYAAAQTTAPSRTMDAIQADMQATESQLNQAIEGGHALQSAEARKTAAAKAVPAIEKMLSLLNELALAQPQQKSSIEQGKSQLQVLAGAFGDSTQLSSMSKAQLAMADYLKADDEAGQNKALDEFAAALNAAPGDPNVLSLIPMTSLGLPPSVSIYRHLLTILQTDTQSPDAQQLATQMAGQVKMMEMVGQPLTIQGVALTDPNFSTAQWKGKVIFVDFWATWCGPCLEELPRVKQMYSQYHTKGLEMLGVSCDNSGADLKKFLAENPDMPWPQLFDERTAGWHPLATEYGITGIPTMFLIDRKGILRTVDARSQMEDLIPKLLSEQP